MIIEQIAERRIKKVMETTLSGQRVCRRTSSLATRRSQPWTGHPSAFLSHHLLLLVKSFKCTCLLVINLSAISADFGSSLVLSVSHRQYSYTPLNYFGWSASVNDSRLSFTSFVTLTFLLNLPFLIFNSLSPTNHFLSTALSPNLPPLFKRYPSSKPPPPITS